jgi:glycerol-3-phosphate dehydrogenase
MLRREPLPQGPFDLTVIGGGINGAAIARDAVLRGLAVCLLESGDFAGGTSSATSKMVHGGIRYLEQMRLGLVFEALRERSLLLRLAPHLVRPQPFVIPIYRGARRGAKWIRAGLLLYDALALGRRVAPARMLGPEEAARLIPGLRAVDLVAGGLYYDAVMDDSRLCLMNLLDARDAAAPGRFCFRNYAQVVERRATSPITLKVRDRVLDREFTVQSHRVVRAVGPWTDLEGQEPLLIPSKGTHIVLSSREALTGSREADRHGLLLSHQKDGRVFFVIPWLGRTLVGTTESPFSGDPARLRVEFSEVDYLVTEFRRLFPEARVGAEDFLGAFTGVRPLARAGRQVEVPRASRRHRILDDGHGTLTVVGGKFTTYRAVAKGVVDRLLPGTRTSTARRPLPGGELGPWERYRAGEARFWIDRFGEGTVRSLFDRYGCRLREVLEPAMLDPALAEPIGPGCLRAEARHAVLREAVLYPEDFLSRRTKLRFSPGGGREAYPAVEEEIRAAMGGLPHPGLEAARARYFRALDEEERLRAALAAPLVRSENPLAT